MIIHVWKPWFTSTDVIETLDRWMGIYFFKFPLQRFISTDSIGTLDTYQWIFLHISPTKVVYIHRCYRDLRYMNAFSFKIPLQRFISTHFIGTLDTYEWIMLYISLTYKGVYPNFIGTLVTRMNIYSNFLYSGHLTSWHWFFLFGRLLLKKCPYFDFLDYFDFLSKKGRIFIIYYQRAFERYNICP